MLVVVGGHSRNIGKTSVVAGLIRKLRDLHWTALKITQYGNGVCPNHTVAAGCGCEPDGGEEFALSRGIRGGTARTPAGTWRRERSAPSGCGCLPENCRARRGWSTRFWRRAST